MFNFFEPLPESSRQAYPKTAILFDVVHDNVNHPDTMDARGIARTCEEILNNFSEYEHGTAGPDDIHSSLNLDILFEVYHDLILAVACG